MNQEQNKGWDGEGERRCTGCGAKIQDCNGFVNAEDFLKLLMGQRVPVRELCGRCILLRDPELIGLRNGQDSQNRDPGMQV